MNFSNIFAYLELATGAVSVIGTIQHLVAGSAPLTGAELVATVQPIIQGIQQIFPQITIPMDLVTPTGSKVSAFPPAPLTPPPTRSTITTKKPLRQRKAFSSSSVAASDSYLGRPFLLAFLSPRPGAAVQSIDSKEFSLWRRNQALGLE